MKISDLVRDIKLKQIDVTEAQIMDCIENPQLPKGEAFDSDIYAKQIRNKVLIVCCKDNSVIDVIFTDIVNDISYYKDAGYLYRVAFTATGKKSFYNSGPNFEVWGKTE